MIICLCHRVSDRDIAREAREGCADFDELQDRLRVGTACGCCLDHAQQAFHEQAAACRGCAGSARCGSPAPAVAA
jgi:bacterioferritin-associated ferredoxin